MCKVNTALTFNKLLVSNGVSAAMWRRRNVSTVSLVPACFSGISFVEFYELLKVV